jgi:4-oxalocrotonate tautomerase
MPLIEVKIYESRLTRETQEKLIEQLTEATAAVFGSEIRDHTWVILHPIPAERWGIAGRPGGK